MRFKKRTKVSYHDDAVNQKKFITRTNKRRSKEMERNVAKILGGNRIPMSGAGCLKGDGLVYSKYGLIIVECKLSSLIETHRSKNPDLKFNYYFDYMVKLNTDVHSMKAKFGIIVFHYWNTRNNYVIIAEDVYRNILKQDSNFPVMVTKNKSLFSLKKRTVDNYLSQEEGFIIDFENMGEKIVVMDIYKFRDIIAFDE